MKNILALFLLLTTTATQSNNTPQPGNLIKRDYKGFTLYISCENRVAERFEYTLGLNTADFIRTNNFHVDSTLQLKCQQISLKPYSFDYDRGHLVSAEQMNDYPSSMYDSFTMTNILPQHKRLNRGLWKQTENRTECLRKLSTITVKGGVLFTDPSNDYFIKSHGIKTPDYFWKIIINDKGNYIAWEFPNHGEAGANLKSYEIDKNILTMLGINVKFINNKLTTCQ